MKLSIIIVSYNTKNLLKHCLEAVFSSNFPKKNLETWVVDNASTDNSVVMVKKHFPQAKLIFNKTNLGFAKANNQGIKKATGEYILLLNSDTELKPDTLKNLIDFMDSHPQAGIASAQLINPDGTIQPSGGFLPRLSNLAAWMLFIDDLPIIKSLLCAYHVTRPGFYKKTRPLGWVQGAAMILRQKMLSEIGLLDDKIFMYGEDIDLCIRARNKGWQVWSVAQAQVTHKRFQSSGGSSNRAILGEYQGLKYIFRKHKPTWETPLLKLLLGLGALLRQLIFGTILKDKELYDVYVQAFKLARQ